MHRINANVLSIGPARRSPKGLDIVFKQFRWNKTSKAQIILITEYELPEVAKYLVLVLKFWPIKSRFDVL